jgi:hypothetical protein
MNSSPTLRAAWSSLWTLRRHHPEPAWARLLVATGMAVALALGLMLLVGVVGHVEHPNWVLRSIVPNVLICICIVFTVLALLRLCEATLPAPLLARLDAASDVRAGMSFSIIVLFGIMLGMALAFTVVPPLLGFSARTLFTSLPGAYFKFVVFLFVVGVLNWVWWRARIRSQQLQHAATEAQLRLLQGQIEPHFLFNTLANVQSLMDADPPRARQMLEAFSDYLRAGLGQLRAADSTLGAELAMVQSYLELLQIRMGERLQFSIEADAAARALRLPPLFLQPLVENAIVHGLEPKIDGGTVAISARVADGRLLVRVDDDGMGLDSPRRHLRASSGMALANVRSRLHTRFGAHATLTLGAVPAGEGTRAELDLPLAAGLPGRVP